ncbi:MAG: hypothetical protein ACTSU5_17905, partial [Promethearchaeota archaeon]
EFVGRRRRAAWMPVEMILEPSVSAVAAALGAPQGLANQVGEQLGSAEIVASFLNPTRPKGATGGVEVRLSVEAQVLGATPPVLEAFVNPATRALHAWKARLAAARAPWVNARELEFLQQAMDQMVTGGDTSHLTRNVLADPRVNAEFSYGGKRVVVSQFQDTRGTIRDLRTAVTWALSESRAQHGGSGDPATFLFSGLLDYFGRLGQQGRAAKLVLQNRRGGGSVTFAPLYGTTLDPDTAEPTRLPVGYSVVATDDAGNQHTRYYRVVQRPDGTWVTDPGTTGTGGREYRSLNALMAWFDTIRVVDPSWMDVELDDPGSVRKFKEELAEKDKLVVEVHCPASVRSEVEKRADELFESSNSFPIARDFEGMGAEHGVPGEFISSTLLHWRVEHFDELVNYLRSVNEIAGFDIRNAGKPRRNPDSFAYRIYHFLAETLFGENPPTYPVNFLQLVAEHFGRENLPSVYRVTCNQFLAIESVRNRIDELWPVNRILGKVFPKVKPGNLRYDTYHYCTQQLLAGRIPRYPEVRDYLLENGLIDPARAEKSTVSAYVGVFYRAFDAFREVLGDDFKFPEFRGTRKGEPWLVLYSSDMYLALSYIDGLLDAGSLDLDTRVIANVAGVSREVAKRAKRIALGTHAEYEVPSLEEKYVRTKARIQAEEERYIESLLGPDALVYQMLEKLWPTGGAAQPGTGDAPEQSGPIAELVRGFTVQARAKYLALKDGFLQGGLDAALRSWETLWPAEERPELPPGSFDRETSRQYPAPKFAEEVAGEGAMSGTINPAIHELAVHGGSTARPLREVLPVNWLAELFALFQAKHLAPKVAGAGGTGTLRERYEAACRNARPEKYAALITGAFGEYVDLLTFRQSLGAMTGGRVTVEFEPARGGQLRANPLVVREARGGEVREATPGDPALLHADAATGRELYLLDVVPEDRLSKHFAGADVASLNENKPTDLVYWFEERWTGEDGAERRRLVGWFSEATVYVGRLSSVQHLYHGIKLVWDQVNTPEFGEHVAGGFDATFGGDAGCRLHFDEFRAMFTGTFLRRNAKRFDSEQYKEALVKMASEFDGTGEMKGQKIFPIYGNLGTHPNKPYFTAIRFVDPHAFLDVVVRGGREDLAGEAADSVRRGGGGGD